MLDRNSLEVAVDAVVGGQTGRKRWADILDFAAPRTWKDLTWKDILPHQTRVNVGTHDLLVDDIQAFCRNAVDAGANVELEIMDGEPHAWNLIEDRKTEGAYRNQAPDETVAEGSLVGTQIVAKALFGMTKNM